MEESAMMVTIRVLALSVLLTTALSAPVNVTEESMILFQGEDFLILLPSLDLEVRYQNRSSPRSSDVVLVRNGTVINGRAKLNQTLRHLILDTVGEGDEGLYTIKNPVNPEDIRRIKLIVRDCSHEQIIRYGGNFQIPVTGLTPPITLEYRPSAVEAVQTSSTAQMLLTTTGKHWDGYQGRISVSERQVTLSAVTGADEGSYTIRDAEGTIRKKVCLNVKEHQNFVTLPYGSRLKINLILNSSLVQLYYRPSNDPKPRLLLDKGEFTSALVDLRLEDRVSLDGSLVFLDQVKLSDAGQFNITDMLGFTVSSIHLSIEPYKLEMLYVAIIALSGLLVFLLLVCLLFCLIRIKKRARRAAALEKIAQNAGKEHEGEAFRQVVKNITKLSEESKNSAADSTEKSQSTEVDIKGLEVSSKEVGVSNLETSDSGVGFNTALPLDTDTDAPDPISESTAVTISVAPQTKSSPPSAAEPKRSPPPVMEIKPSPVAETKPAPDQPKEVNLDQAKTAEVKLSLTPNLEPKAVLGPADPKPPPSPNSEHKPAVSPATIPIVSESAPTTTPEPPNPTAPEPITNGSPEPDKPIPDQTDVIGVSAPKAAPPKTPEVELKTSGDTSEVSKDGVVAEDSATAT